MECSRKMKRPAKDNCFLVFRILHASLVKPLFGPDLRGNTYAVLYLYIIVVLVLLLKYFNISMLSHPIKEFPGLTLGLKAFILV